MVLIDMTNIEIACSPAEVRGIVLDFGRMHEWHMGFLKVLRPLPNGTRPEEMQQGDDMFLKFLSLPGQDVKVVENSPDALAWEGGPALLFHGIHKMEFPPIDGGRATHFRNSDLYSGIFGAGAALSGIKGNVSKLYEGYNRDLKKRCE